MSAETENSRSFEENMGRLEQIVSLLEQGDAELAQSLALFEEGTRLAAACQAMLEEAEQKVSAIRKGPGGQPEALPFPDEED